MVHHGDERGHHLRLHAGDATDSGSDFAEGLRRRAVKTKILPLRQWKGRACCNDRVKGGRARQERQDRMVARTQSQQGQHVRIPANESCRSTSFSRKLAYSGISHEGHQSAPVVRGRGQRAYFCADAKSETVWTNAWLEERDEEQFRPIGLSNPISRGTTL